MDGIQLEKLYVAIDAQTTEFNKQMTQVDNSINKMDKSIQKSTSGASKSFKRLGKMLATVFIGAEINNFLRRMTELSSKAAEFKQTVNNAMKALADSITPILETIVKSIAIAVSFIAGMIRQMLKLGKATDSTANSQKKLNKQYAGFDELNTVTTDSQDDVVNSLIDVNEYINKGMEFWKEYGALITGIIVGIAALLATNWLKNIIDITAAFGGFWNLLLEGTGLISQAFNALSYGFFKLFGGEAADSILLFGKSFDIAVLSTNVALASVIAFVVAVVAIGAAIYQLWNETSARGEAFRANVTAAFQGILDTAQLLWSYLKPIFDGFLAMAIMIWEYGLKPLWDGFVELVAGVVALISVLWLNWLKPLVDFLIKVFGPIVQIIFLGIGGVLSVLLTLVLNIVGTILKAFGGLLTWLSTVLKGGWNSLFKGLGNAFIGLVNLVISGINLMIAGFLSPINGLIKGWNDTIGKIAGKIPEIKISIPLIPYLAKGGSLDAGSLFVAGEAGAEMVGNYNGKTTVMPLENTSFVAAMKAAMVEGLTEAMGGQSGSVVINVDGMTLAKSVETNLNKLSLAKGGLDIAL